MKSISNRRRRGNAAIEFALVFLPLTMLIVGVLETARFAWVYQSVASTVKSMARFSVVHGERCLEANPGCQRTLEDLVKKAMASSIGVDPQLLDVSLTSGATTRSCVPLALCAGSVEAWPPLDDNTVGTTIRVDAKYRFQPFSYVPGTSKLVVGLVANSQEVIQF